MFSGFTREEFAFITKRMPPFFLQEKCSLFWKRWTEPEGTYQFSNYLDGEQIARDDFIYEWFIGEHHPNEKVFNKIDITKANPCLLQEAIPEVLFNQSKNDVENYPKEKLEKIYIPKIYDLELFIKENLNEEHLRREVNKLLTKICSDQGMYGEYYGFLNLIEDLEELNSSTVKLEKNTQSSQDKILTDWGNQSRDKNSDYLLKIKKSILSK